MTDSLLAPQWSGTPVASLTSDDALLQDFYRVERAWLLALESGGCDTSGVIKTLTELEKTSPGAAEYAAAAWMAGNPVVGFVEHLRGALKDAGVDSSLFHGGLTSQDVLDTALMVMASRTLETISADLVRQGDRLAELAETHRTTPSLGTTLTRGAEVTLWGVRVAHWLESLTEAHLRIVAARAELPIGRGGAVGDGKALTEILQEHSSQNSPTASEAVYERFATELGLHNPGYCWHSNRQPVMRLAHALAEAGMAMATIARNLVQLGRPEISEVQGTSAHGVGGSSAMAHKQNPIRPLLVFSSGHRIPGIVAQITHTSATVDERGEGEWNAQWEPLRDVLRIVGGQSHHLAKALDALKIDTAAAARRIENSEVPAARITAERTVALGHAIDRAVKRWQEARG